jgi:hypothetical protein
MQRVLPYLTGKSGVSLRLIDWFVTNFSKQQMVVIQGPETGLNVYNSYRAQLKAYSKQQFDPFRRRDRIVFFYERTQSVETTIGQLNFFRWMLVNHVLDYVVEHADQIEADMLTSQKHPKSAAEVEGETTEHASADKTTHASTAAMTRVTGRQFVLFD